MMKYTEYFELTSSGLALDTVLGDTVLFKQSVSDLGSALNQSGIESESHASLLVQLK